MTRIDDGLNCLTCGFPKAMKRNPVFIKNDIFPLIRVKLNTCKECGHQKDGTSIPVVQEAVKEIVVRRCNSIRLSTLEEVEIVLDKLTERLRLCENSLSNNKDFKDIMCTLQTELESLKRRVKE